ncbi:MAG: extracellular solute-binding protein [Clostridia bacterium]
MKRIISIILCLVLALSCFSGCQNKDDARENVLRIYNWEDYMEPQVLEDFKVYYKEKYGIELEIIYETFDTNETMLTKVEKAHEDYDLVCPSDYIIEKMVDNGLVIPMDMNIVGTPYNNSVSQYFRDQYAAASGNNESTLYSIGYMWGTMGIIYNKEHVSIEELQEQGWGILWNEKFKGKIFMKDSLRESICVGNIYVYEDEYKALKKQFDSGELALKDYTASIQALFNRTDPDTIAKIEEALIGQKNIVDAMYDVDNDKNAMVNGSAYLDVAWSGDATWAQIEAGEANNGVELGYYVPDYASNIWFDGWVIPKYAKNIQAANEFAAYLLRPDVAIKIMDFIGYPSVVSSPETLAYAQDMAFEDDENADVTYFFDGATDVCVNSTMFPPIAVVNSCAVMNDYKDATDAMSAMWARIKGNYLTTTAIVVLIVFAVGVTGILVYNAITKRKKKVLLTHKKNSYKPE